MGVKMQIHQIGGLGFDSNVYLIIDEVVALIDAGTGMNFDSVRRRLKEFKLEPGDVEIIINTHCHFDHVGGGRDFVEAGAEVAIHGQEAAYLRGGDQIVTCANFFGANLAPLQVGIELSGGEKINLGEVSLEVLHTPGHTRGSVCLYDPDHKLLFSGDTVFCDGFGRVDLPTGSKSDLLSSMERLANLKVQKLFPGHGPIAQTAGEKFISEALNLLREWRD